MEVEELKDSTDDSDDSFDSLSPPPLAGFADVEYHCLFVDYGDKEWVGSKEVEPIWPELLEVSL